MSNAQHLLHNGGCHKFAFHDSDLWHRTALQFVIDKFAAYLETCKLDVSI